MNKHKCQTKNDTKVRGGFGLGWSSAFGGDFPSGLYVEPNETVVHLVYRAAANTTTVDLDASDLDAGDGKNIIYGHFNYYIA